MRTQDLKYGVQSLIPPHKNVVWLQRKRQAEAINGAWAMIGLTAGLVVEGSTGNGILAQVRLNWLVLIIFDKKNIKNKSFLKLVFI